jgi:flagellar basal body rod protein FlgG
MSDGMFRSLSGARAAWRTMEVVSNNAANVSTTGFQAGRIAFETFGDGEHLDEGYATVSTVRPVRRAGPLQATGGATDVALEGPGYFAIETGGGVLFTRDGDFQLNSEGVLTTRDGWPVMGESGPIQVPPGETPRIAEDGVVTTSSMGEVGRIVRMDGALAHAGGNLWRATGPMLEVETPVVSGHLEGSSVDPMRTMVELIEASKHFEMLQKAMQSDDEMTSMMNNSGK